MSCRGGSGHAARGGGSSPDDRIPKEDITMRWSWWQEEEPGPDLLKGVIAGAAAGLVATAVMTLAQTGMSKLEQRAKPRRPGRSEGPGAGGEDDDPATVKAASAVSEKVLGHELTEREKPIAGNLVHYGFGTTMGGVYGGLAEVVPSVTACEGMAFGAGLMVLADEVAVPAVGLSEPPHRVPLSKHAYALAAHLVYGVTCEIARRGFRNLLDRTY
jgi:hypothetical protein